MRYYSDNALTGSGAYSGRGKTIQPLALPLKGVTALFAVDETDKSPGMIKI
jgi:hypothetical protein